MADKQVTVEVLITGKNQVGPAAKAAQDAVNGISGGAGGGGAGGAGGAFGGGVGAGIRQYFHQVGANIAAAWRTFKSQWASSGAASGAMPPGGPGTGGQPASVGAFEALTGAVQKLHGALALATGAAIGFLAAGNPMLMSTFTGSIQLLGARISEMLIPAFIAVSGAIQRMANWVKNLDSDVKGWIATGIKWVAGIALVTVGAVKLISVIGAVGTALKAVISFGAVAFSNPMVLGVTAVTVAVGMLIKNLGILDGLMDKISGRSSIYAKPLDTVGQSVHGAIGSGTIGNGANTAWRIGSAVNDTLNMALPGGGALGWLQNKMGLSQGGANERGMDSVIPRIEAQLRANGVSEEQIRLRIGAIRDAGLQINTPEGRTRAAQIAQTQVEDGGFMSSGIRSTTHAGGAEFYGTLLQDVLGRGQIEQQILAAQLANTARTVEAINALGRRGDVNWGEGMSSSAVESLLASRGEW